MATVSLNKAKIKILLLEGLHPSTIDVLQQAGYSNIDYHKGSLAGDELLEAVKDVHFIGIRSRTQLTPEVFAAAKKLTAVGCFCIGTNQVDLNEAMRRGIPVFNAPFSNTRSVAELVVGEILLLLRGIPEKNAKAHRGEWFKSADHSFEARGKTLGIIGYGHIGTQLGILAESLGMRVCFYDIETKLSLGNAAQVSSLSELLNKADVVSLHVPETTGTTNLMGVEEFARMKPGAIFINAARGTVILTPHIGGSTHEAQENIGIEVAGKLVKYSDNGSTLSAVGFPEVSLPEHHGCSRLLHIHHNRPGILNQITTIFASEGINIAAQFLQTGAEVGYVVIDVETERSQQALQQLKSIEGTIRARILH